jgi:glucose-1-phosphate thymidylyltransferase
VRILLLAAGYATRMHPLTLNRSKPLLEVGGRAVISRLLDALLKEGEVVEVVVVTNHKFAADFEEWSAHYTPINGSAPPIRVVDDGSMNDDDKLGAIGDINLGMNSTEEDDWFVAAADNLLESDISPQLALFREHGDTVLTVRQVEGVIPPKTYGEVHLSDEGIVTNFVEKPEIPSSDFVSIGLYLYPKRIAARVNEYIEAGNNPDAPGYFVAWLLERETVRSHELKGLWWDIGSLKTLAEARAAYGAEA